MSFSCECCVLLGRKVSATGRSLVQRSPTECGVSEYDREASRMRRPWPTRVTESREKKKWFFNGMGKGFKSCHYGQMKTNRSREERIYAIYF